MHDDALHRRCLTLFVISGAAALIYQVVWVRLLGLSMGTTSAAVSSVVAAFFLGLALGSYGAGLLSKEKTNLFRIYLILEIIIGVSAVIILAALFNLDKIMSVLPFWGTHLLAKFSITIAILLIPTTCMGATFPILALACLRSKSSKTGSFGQFYAFNTLGAVIGVLVSGFVLIPYLGLAQATYIACALNILAGVIAMSMQNQSALIPVYTHPANVIEDVDKSASTSTWFGLIALFTTGLVALGLQISWTQYLSLFMGGTIYGFTAILSIFLIGICSGSWAIHRASRRIVFDETTYLYGLLLFAGTLILTRSGLTLLPDIAYSIKSLQEQTAVYRATKYAIVLSILFVPTFFMGGLFPIAMSIYSAGVRTVRNEFGTGYAVNTLGGIAGVVVAGLWLIPTIGTDRTIVTLIFIVIALIGLFTTALTRRLDKIVSVVAVMFLIWQCFAFTGLNYQNMIMANFYRYDANARLGKLPDFLYLKEGKSSVISIITHDNLIARLQSNGIQESYLSIGNNQPPPKAETLLGVLPYLLHHEAETAFVIGFGGGHTTNALTSTPLKSIRVVELESAVIEAVETVGIHATSALRDERVDLVINDARNTLLVSRDTYDFIVSQPSHPWLSGAGNLFTQEFFEIVSSRLNDDGIFGQWINLFNMDTTTLLSILKAYYTVFPYGFTAALTDTGDLLVFGSNSPIVFDMQQMNTTLEIAGISKILDPWKINKAESVLSLFTISRDQIIQSSANVKTNTDNRIFSEVRLAKLSKDHTGKHSPNTWLDNTADRNMESYFNPEDVVQSLYKLGLHFKTSGQLKELQQVYDRLVSLDIVIAQKLKESRNQK